MKTNLLFTLLLGVFFNFLSAQTVIEMGHPSDANLVLLEVDSPDKADIIVYKTDKKKEYQEWKALLHHFYDPFPEVEHYNSVFSNNL